MTRYTEDHKDETRARILKAAAKEFRSKGWAGATVPGIMETAGLTAGGFYKHFDSKAALFAEMFRETLRKSTERSLALREHASADGWWEALADAYLTPEHRENFRGGCVMAALASDMPRAEPEAKQVYQEELLRYVDELASTAPGDSEEARKRAWSFQALMLGGLVMARGMESEATARELLEACRQAAGALETDSRVV